MGTTKTRTTQWSLLLLDADVIIDLHKFGVWDEILSKHKIFISSIILRQEVYYYEDEQGNQHDIDMKKDMNKRFKVRPVNAQDLAGFAERFDAVLGPEIHHGEKEALHLLTNDEELGFCTCDRAAVIALGLLDLGERGVSFESLLKSCGITKKLSPKHTEKRFQQYLGEASIMKIQNRGLKKKSGGP